MRTLSRLSGRLGVPTKFLPIALGIALSAIFYVGSIAGLSPIVKIPALCVAGLLVLLPGSGELTSSGQPALDIDDRLEVRWLRGVPRRTRYALFGLMAGFIIAVEVSAFHSALSTPNDTVPDLFPIMFATNGFWGVRLGGSMLAMAALARTRTGNAQALWRRSELTERAARRPVRPRPDPDEAMRRRIAERDGTDS